MLSVKSSSLSWLTVMFICAGLFFVSCRRSKTTNKTEEVDYSISITSPGGYTALGVKVHGEEGAGKTIIKKGDNTLGELPYSLPVSFSPTEDILLVAEYAPDDDCQHYLLNIGAGELSKDESKRLDYVFGGRYANKASWSSDGKTITLYYSPELSDIAQKTFSVDNLLSNHSQE